MSLLLTILLHTLKLHVLSGLRRIPKYHQVMQSHAPGQGLVQVRSGF